VTETCSACGAEASGRFCNQCGGAVNAACRECGAALPKGARFCGECGTAVGAAPAATAAAPAATAAAAPAPRAPLLPWIVSGVVLAAILLLVVVPRFREAGGEAKAAPAAAAPEAPFASAGGAGAPGTGTPPDLSTMTPEEAADRLFNRVMTAVANGDTAQATRFVPMAIMAYGRVENLDADGRYHLAALHLVNGDAAAARAEADKLLAASPTHLFGLFVAAQAADATGKRDEAKAFFRRFDASYDAEMAKNLPEYGEHAQGLPQMREQARASAGS